MAEFLEAGQHALCDLIAGHQRPNDSMKSGSRNPVIDMARGLAMVLVIIGHALEIGFNPYFRSEGFFDQTGFSLWRMIYSFHVPVFFFISGLLVPPSSVKSFDKVAKSAVGLILVVYLTEIMFGTLGRVIHYKSNFLPVGTELIETLAVGNNFYLAVTWFLFSIAIVQVLAYFFNRPGLLGKCTIVASSATIFAVSRVFDFQIMQIHTWPIGLFFFLIGSAASSHVVPLLKSGRLAAIALLLVGTLGILLYPFNNGCMFDAVAVCNLNGKPEFVVLIVSGLIGFMPLFLVTAFSGMAAIFGACILLHKTPIEPFLVKIGNHTLVLLVMNGVFFRFVQFGLNKVIGVDLWWASAAVSVVLQIAMLSLSVALMQPLIRFSQHVAGVIVSVFHKPKSMSAT